MNPDRCPSCDRNENAGHNYCRKCGLEFKPGFVKNARVAEVYFSDDEYCGFCGGPRYNCECGN